MNTSSTQAQPVHKIPSLGKHAPKDTPQAMIFTVFDFYRDEQGARFAQAPCNPTPGGNT